MRSTTLRDLIYDTPLMKESRKRKVKKRASGPSGGSISGPLALETLVQLDLPPVQLPVLVIR